MATAPQNAGSLQINQGRYTSDTCTTQNDLILMQNTKPEMRKMLEQRNGRYLMTLLTSGAMNKAFGDFNYNVNTKVSVADGVKIKEAPKGIGNIAYRWDSISTIEKSAIVLSQVGASGTNGAFTLKMQDFYLYKNQIVRFPSGLRAVTKSAGSGSTASGVVYDFQTVMGNAFVFATDCAIKSCFPEYTAYSEGSIKSDSRAKSPDTFINYMTLQRKTLGITGSAQSDVLIYEYPEGKLGWMWWQVQQATVQFAMENERQKKFGVSSMKNSDGSLASTSNLGIDPDTGLSIITGDGFEEQVSSANVFGGTGTNGEFTEDDFTNAMTVMQKGSNQAQNITWVAITGTDGYANAQQKMINLAGNQNINTTQIISQNSKAGGADVEIGYNFAKFNINGNSMHFILDPMFDNTFYFPDLGADGKSLMSSTYFFMGLGTANKPTMEIICKEANGVNRAHVEAKYLGLTGEKGTPLSEYDGTKVAMLKEDMLCVYDNTLCGVGYKNA